MNSQFLLPAFDNPALASQLSFRAALNALAEPGLNQTLPSVQPIAGLASATYALCLSLVDADIPVWLAPAFDSPVLRANLAFHCGCPFVEQREQAAFAVLDASELSDLRGFDTGSERYPDQSCSLIVQLDALEGGEPMRWRGPGIETERLAALPLPPGFWAQRERRTQFPRGLDIFFCAGEQLIGLPRSTRCSVLAQEAS
nr:phosphonate C-P lyase system protein PhnH [Pseudomonas sp.]